MKLLILSGLLTAFSVTATVYLCVEAGRVARDAGRGLVWDTVAREKGFA